MVPLPHRSPKYDGSKNRSPGRPPTAKDIRELIVRVAQENPTWGYTRLRGALKNLGHELGRNTIKRVLADHGIAPAPERGKSMSWSTFIKAHWGAIAATDLFTVEVVNPFGLVRYHVLFVIDIATRCVCIGGITSDPNGEWMKQVARNLTDIFQEEVKDWQNSITVPKVWQRVLLWPFANTEEPKGEIIKEKGL